ncbi:MAG: hypothetical protein JEZ03_01500 [Bacteroidales bacterium]|nr:hypothetical protein [Bacteroidales bacterium]
MKDITSYLLDQDCPECDRSVSVNLKQLANQDQVRCKCGHVFQLNDEGGNAKNVIRELSGKPKMIFR